MRVIGKRMKGGRTCYHLNDGVYHSLNNILMDGFSLENQMGQFYGKQSLSSGCSELKNQEMGSLFGMTCDGYDIIANRMELPEMDVGDWMVMGGMGSYTVGPSSKFNGMEVQKKIVKWSRQDEIVV